MPKIIFNDPGRRRFFFLSNSQKFYKLGTETISFQTVRVPKQNQEGCVDDGILIRDIFELSKNLALIISLSKSIIETRTLCLEGRADPPVLIVHRRATA